MDEVTLKSVLQGLHRAKGGTSEPSGLIIWSEVVSSGAEPDSGTALERCTQYSADQPRLSPLRALEGFTPSWTALQAGPKAA